MKNTLFVGLAALMVATSANAGWLESLGLGKKAAPATLEEACNTDEIKKVCPEVVLGTKTITECLSENVSSLSKQCATYVKKSVSDKAAAVKQDIADKKAESAENKAARTQAIEEKKAAVKEKVAAAKATAAEKKAKAAENKAAAKEKIKAKKAAAKAAGKEIADAVRETGQNAVDTGRTVKELM